MKLFLNKFLLIGTLVLLLISIPITLFFVKQQQEVRSKAAPSSKLFFDPDNPTTSTQCSNFAVNVMIDPGQNIVSIVDFYIKYDPAALDVQTIKENTGAFPAVVRPFSKNAGVASMSVSVGADVTRAVQTISKVATITFVAKTAGPTQIQFDSTKSRVFSLKPADKPTENVLLSGLAPANVTVNTNTCTGGGGLTGTPAPTSGIPGLPPVSTTPGVGGGLTGTPAPSGSVPVCSEFTVAPANSGPAPFSVVFTGKGNSPVTTGLITTTTFTFGDGQTQAVTDGMNLKDVTAQVNHTYQTAGNYTATVVFTDNTGAQSAACNQSINTTASVSASPTLVEKPTMEAPPVEEPTIEPTGSVVQTFGIIGAVILTIVGGFIFLAL